MFEMEFEGGCVRLSMDRNTRKKIQNIHQALGAAVSSVNLAKRLLNEFESVSSPSPRELPGEFGSFDGHFMVTGEGQKYPIPENYASKSKLVYGDRLKRIVQDGEELFKQVERVRRQEIGGILAKKDGKWYVIDSHGSYEVLPAAVSYFGVGEGEEVRAVIPQDEPHTPFAALLGVVGGKAKSRDMEISRQGDIGTKKGVVEPRVGVKRKKAERAERIEKTGKKPAAKAKKAAARKEEKKEAAPEEELR